MAALPPREDGWSVSMARRWTVGVLAAAAIVAILGASQAQEAGAAAGGGGLLPVAAAALALAALAVAVLALMRARRAETELTRFTRSIEMALRDLTNRSERDAASMGEMNRKLGDEIRTLVETAAALPAAEPAAASAPPSAESGGPAPAVRPAGERAAEPSSAEAEPSASEVAHRALAQAIAAGEAEVSLQPIISVAQSAASGFEVHMHLEQLDGGRGMDIRRLAKPVPGVDAAAFEAALIRAAIASGRRQLGTSTERMPFHVAISEALLGSEQDVASIAELARVHKALPASIVFSLPAALLGAGGEIRQRIDQLTAAGFRLAAENWDGGAADAAAAARRGVAYLKVSANRLLDRERSRRRLAPGAELVAAAQEAGLAMVATGVARDEDAVGLIDLGVDLMVGERFSGPRRMRSAAARQAAMTGT